MRRPRLSPRFWLSQLPRLTRLPLVALVFGSLLGVTGCGESTPPADDVLYVGTASDEAYLAVVDYEDRAAPDPDLSASFTSPKGSVSAAEPATFAWELPVDPGETVGGCAASTGGLTVRHCPAYSGYIYWLQVEDDSGTRLANVVSSLPEWTPDEETWSRMTDGTTRLTLRLIVAYLVMNEVTEGPYLTETTVEVR